MPWTKKMASPQTRETMTKADEDSMPNRVNVKHLIDKVNEIRDLIEAGLTVPDNELEKILEGLSANNDGNSEVQKLQRIIATLHDDFRHQSKAVKSIVWLLNVVAGQVAKMASHHDLCRTERAGDFTPRGTRSETWSQVRKWNSDGDLPSASHADIQPLPPKTASQPIAQTVMFDYWRSLEEMLKIYGLVERTQMGMLLGIWRSKSGFGCRSTDVLLEKTTHFLQDRLASLQQGVGSVDDASQLVTKSREFHNKPLQELLGLTTTQVNEVVIDSIPEEDWLLFARSELGMTESDIAEVKCHSTPTDEQLRQMDLVQDAWNLAHDATV